MDRVPTKNRYHSGKGEKAMPPKRKRTGVRPYQDVGLRGTTALHPRKTREEEINSEPLTRKREPV